MVDSAEYETYKSRNIAALKAMLEGVGCRPVLFLGSGITKRYIGGPSWLELLSIVAERIGLEEGEFAFLAQRADNDPVALGTALSDKVHEWAWKSGQNTFPKNYFNASTDRSLFIKGLVADHLEKMMAEASDNDDMADEIDLLKRISPHAVITTNFDTLVEVLYPDYELVCGEKIIPLSMNITGEIYKIHGTTADPASMVLIDADYARYTKKRRYITSKMMTYFAEYPVVILGYGLGDTNINSIISDLGEALRDKGGLLENVIYVEWVPDIGQLSSLREEYAIPTSDDPTKSLRLRTIVTSDLRWVLESLADLSAPVPVQTKTLRELAARVVDLVRTDIPRDQIEVNYEHIEKLIGDKSELASILGISNVTNPNLAYPYLMSQVGQLLGFKGWHAIHKLMAKANQRAGYNIKSSDNEYHIAYKSGKTNITHKFSEAFVSLIRDVTHEGELALEGLEAEDLEVANALK